MGKAKRDQRRCENCRQWTLAMLGRGSCDLKRREKWFDDGQDCREFTIVTVGEFGFARGDAASEMDEGGQVR